MPTRIDYTKYRSPPCWSSLPLPNYTLVGADGSRTSPLKVVYTDVAAWNLYWAIAERCEIEAPGSRVDLVRLPDEAEKALRRLPRFRYPIHDTGGKWTIAAMMCRFTPEEMMLRYWPSIARIAKLPLERGHLFSS
jgi:hypothetical protein